MPQKAYWPGGSSFNWPRECWRRSSLSTLQGSWVGEESGPSPCAEPVLVPMRKPRRSTMHGALEMMRTMKEEGGWFSTGEKWRVCTALGWEKMGLGRKEEEGLG